MHPPPGGLLSIAEAPARARTLTVPMVHPTIATEIPYTVRRSARARRVRVNVHAHTGVEVVLPTRAPERAAAAAVQRAAPVDRAPAGRGAGGARARIAARGGTVPYLGTPLQLVPQAGRTRVHRAGERLLVPAGDARPALERFYRRAARAEIAPRLDRATALAGGSYSGLTSARSARAGPRARRAGA